jgi:hypothetical protein
MATLVRLPFSDKRIIPRNTEQGGKDGSSAGIPPVSQKRKTLGIPFRTIFRREKTSEFRFEPFAEEKKPPNSVPNYFGKEKLRNSVPNQIFGTENTRKSVPNHFWEHSKKGHFC